MESKFEQIKTVASKNPQILACGSAFTNVMRAMAKAEADYIDQKMREELEILNEEARISALGGTSFSMTILDESAFEVPQQDISTLKKRIKYCKNHMERKQLERELNALYKEQKRRK